VSISGTYQQDTVVDGSAAIGEDTAPVRAPDGSIDGNGDGATAQAIEQVIAAWDIDEAFDLVEAGVDFAGLVTGDVLILFSGIESLEFNVLEGRVHPSTIAALVSLGPRTIN
jgi:hypothetical protein